MDGLHQQDSDVPLVRVECCNDTGRVCIRWLWWLTKLKGIMVEWHCWPCICMMSADERRGTDNRWGKALYRWLQEMNHLTKCKATILHGPQWLKYIQCTSSSKSTPRCSPQKKWTATCNKEYMHNALYIKLTLIILIDWVKVLCPTNTK